MAYEASDRDLKEIKSILKELLDRLGPRLTGNPSTLACAQSLHDRMSESCDRVISHPFTLHPHSFWLMPSGLSLTFGLAILFFLLDFPSWSLLLVLGTGFGYLTLHFIFLSDRFDPLFPKRRGLNVAGIIEPLGAVKRQLVLTAHHDSAKRCRFLEGVQVLYPVRMIAGMGVYFTTTLATLLSTVLGGEIARLTNAGLPYLLGVGVVVVLPFFFFNRSEGTLGAGDNLLSSVLLVKVAQEVRKMGEQGLNSTRLVLVSHDGEEVGMRGAKAFVRDHRALLQEYPVSVLTLDSLHRHEDLTLLSSDRNGLIRLSSQLNDQLLRLWSGLGFQVNLRPLPLGGGGTDAAVYAVNGYPAASLIGIATRLVRRGLVYHTEKDDVEHLDDLAITMALEMVLALVHDLDRD